jgi:hypothetical protein
MFLTRRTNCQKIFEILVLPLELSVLLGLFRDPCLSLLQLRDRSIATCDAGASELACSNDLVGGV